MSRSPENRGPMASICRHRIRSNSVIAMRLLALALLFSGAQMIRATPPTLDGGSSLPSQRSQSYQFKCPDGVVNIRITQRKHDASILVRLSYAGRSILRNANAPINDFLRKLWSLESLTPRCLTAGGAEIVLTGMGRDQVPLKKHVVGVTIDKRGRVSLD